MAKNESNRPGQCKLTRDSYDLHWLDVEKIAVEGRSFHQCRAVEKNGARSVIQPYLTQALHDHHTNRSRIASVFERLEYKEAAAFFAQELPTGDRSRKGNFGEVVASEHLIQRFGYAMPVLKLRHRDSGLPMRGEDIVAFDISGDGKIARVIIGEAKLAKKYNKQTVIGAIQRLKTAYNPRPMTLSLLSNILAGQGNELYIEIDRVSDLLSKKGFPRQNWIILINEKQPDDPFVAVAEDDEPLSNMECIGITLPDVTTLVNELFDAGPRPSSEAE